MIAYDPRDLADSDDQDAVRRRWLARLGRSAELDYPLLLVSNVWRPSPGVSIATCEVASGRVSPGDTLEASGYIDAPLEVRVMRIERADDAQTVVTALAADAGQIVGVTLAHDAASSVEPGQCVAPPGRITTTREISADVWLLSEPEVDVSGSDKRRLLRHLVYGQGLELFFHTRSVPASPLAAWTPQFGREYALGFRLAETVPLYEGTRFGVRYEGLTVGAGFVLPRIA